MEFVVIAELLLLFLKDDIHVYQVRQKIYHPTSALVRVIVLAYSITCITSENSFVTDIV